MAPFSEIVLRDITPAAVAAILRNAGVDVRTTESPSENAENLSLGIQCAGIDPFSVCVLTKLHGTNDTRFIYMESNGSFTLRDCMLFLLSPILAIPNLIWAFFTPDKEYVPTEYQRSLADARHQVIAALASHSSFVDSGIYDGKLYP